MNPILRREFLGALGIRTTTAAFEAAPALVEAAPPAGRNGEQRRVFASDRSDGRFSETAGFLHHLMKTNPPKLGFDPAMKREEFPAWQAAIRQKLAELMAFPEVPPQPPPKRLWIRKKQGYQIQKWEAYPEPYSVVPFMIVIPDGVSPRSLPDGEAFALVLRLDRIAGENAAAVSAEEIDRRGNKVRDVVHEIAEGEVMFSVDPKDFAYRVRLQR